MLYNAIGLPTHTYACRTQWPDCELQFLSSFPFVGLIVDYGSRYLPGSVKSEKLVY